MDIDYQDAYGSMIGCVFCRPSSARNRRAILRDFSVSCARILVHMCAVSNLKVLLTREQIAQRVKELGAEITRDFAG